MLERLSSRGSASLEENVSREKPALGVRGVLDHRPDVACSNVAQSGSAGPASARAMGGPLNAGGREKAVRSPRWGNPAARAACARIGVDVEGSRPRLPRPVSVAVRQRGHAEEMTKRARGAHSSGALPGVVPESRARR